MEATLIKEAKVLVPNKETIPEGTVINGEFKSIKGMRRGEPFSYRVFISEDGQIIYSKNIKEMKPTEVILGADGNVTPTTVDFLPAEAYKKERMIATIAGAAGAYFYAKKKGKNAMKWAAIGGVIGYVAVMVLDKSKDGVVTPSK